MLFVIGLWAAGVFGTLTLALLDVIGAAWPIVIFLWGGLTVWHVATILELKEQARSLITENAGLWARIGELMKEDPGERRN